MWPLELRQHCTERLLGANPPTVDSLFAETGIPTSTLARWRNEAKRKGQVLRESFMGEDKRPSQWPPQERFRVLMESQGLSGEELGEFLRREGLHESTLEEWRADALAGLAGKPRRSKEGKVSRRERALQRELRRKEKALAETAALLVLQKKLHALFGEDEDDTSDGS